MEELMMIEPGQEHREGFPPEVMSELLQLRTAFITDPIGCAHPNNTAAQNKLINEQVNHTCVRTIVS
jgi:hypothetical protein